MEDEKLLRYSRQILLPQVNIHGQQKLLNASAIIFGLGGLGSPVAMYLAAAGIGRLVLVDFDVVELSNLQRQVIHQTEDIGRLKVESARDKLAGLNPEVEIEMIQRKLSDGELDNVVASVDIIIDCTDNFETRFAINRACFNQVKPLISGAAIRFEGQISVYHPGVNNSPCYQCLYRSDTGADQTCSETGVIAPLLGIIGGVQALEAMKVIMRVGTDLTGRLLLLDAMSMEWQVMRFNPDPNCPVCGGKLC
ncbi:MAG TPA: molybdopterin-synthase adenylyltransferase MoeB [Gammaproteobacteria bacterium]|nr:molybdopterin-synthase adenylyltransferase MoeB [Gammaproteobacteria bacterium]|tara:strand:+ start:2466 stop:3218 length:753 start_codon:yes stop_codon:yes gene_type:complete